MQDLNPIREATIWYIKKIVRNAKSSDFEREVDAISEKGRNNLGSCVCFMGNLAENAGAGGAFHRGED